MCFFFLFCQKSKWLVNPKTKNRTGKLYLILIVSLFGALDLRVNDSEERLVGTRPRRVVAGRREQAPGHLSGEAAAAVDDGGHESRAVMVLLASDGPTHQGCGGSGRPAKHGCDCHLQRQRVVLGFRVLGLCVYGNFI